MHIYMVYDKKTGDVLHMHHEVDAERRSVPCNPEDVLRLAPSQFDRGSLGITVTELQQIPSPREIQFRVDVRTGAVKVERLAVTGSRKAVVPRRTAR